MDRFLECVQAVLGAQKGPDLGQRKFLQDYESRADVFCVSLCVCFAINKIQPNEGNGILAA